MPEVSTNKSPHFLKQGSEPILELHTDRPEGFFKLLRIAEALKKPDPELATWLQDAAVAMEAGADPKDALQLARRKGRPRLSNKDWWEQIRMGARACHLKKSGLTYEHAIAAVVKECFASESTVKRCYRDYLEIERMIQTVQAVEQTFLSELRALSSCLTQLARLKKQRASSVSPQPPLCALAQDEHI